MISEKVDRIREINQQARLLEEEKQGLLRQLQTECSHDRVIQYRSGLDRVPTLRKCCLCGLNTMDRLIFPAFGVLANPKELIMALSREEFNFYS